jgi:hypothetical protein
VHYEQEAPGKSKGKGKGSVTASTSAKKSPMKHSVSGNPGERVPKKATRPAKFCQHCKSKGSPHLTHNTNKYCKYDKCGNPVAAAAGKPSEAKKPFKKGGTSRWLI